MQSYMIFSNNTIFVITLYIFAYLYVSKELPLQIFSILFIYD